MHSKNLADEKYQALKDLFPNAITETKDKNGEVVRAIDKDVLMQEISAQVVEGKEERYQFTWPDKKKAILNANAPINKTLRPAREESVNFDETENLYIEGDNLEVLKLLQETYLGKVKMIYIDPPYNTGNDFVYNDDFKESVDEYLDGSGQYDEEGNRLEKNLESNGRYHTDWLNMIYPRLKIARDLLSEDGVIFISIDDNEQYNLKKICDEIYGEENFVNEFVWKSRNSLQHNEPLVSKQTERIMLYVSNKKNWGSGLNKFNKVRKPFDATQYSNPDNDPRGPWLSSGKTRNDGRKSYTVISPSGKKFTKPWIPSPEEFKRWEEENLIWWGKNGDSIPRKKSFLKDFEGNAISDLLLDEYTDEVINEYKVKRKKIWEIGTTETGSKHLKSLFDNFKVFDYPKPHSLVKYFCEIATDKDSKVLDFFSGTATTAHAVMKLNAEDGGNRKYIMVQLPEETDEKSEAYKAGYKTISEIGKERIRRAGKQILEENKNEEGIEKLDIGFRVLKTDSSNMKDVYYSPAYTEQNFLDDLEDNIKEDRTSEDLLFQVMLDLGVSLSSKIESQTIAGKEVFVVEDGFLIACFDKDVSEDTVKEIANKEPYYVVFRDKSMASDSVAANFDQIFASISPETIRKVI